MIPLIGYNLSYQRKAFKSRIDPDGLLRMALESSLNRAARFVYSNSEGHWLIALKSGFVPFDKDEPIELTVIVPAGSNHYGQYLAAIKEFENCMTETGYPLMNPMDTSLRTIEDNGPKCEIPACNKKPSWVRSTQFSGSHYFCAEHAQKEEDFGESDPSYFFWRQLESATT